MMGFLEYLAFHIGVSITLYLLLNRDLKKTERFLLRRLFIIKEMQHMLNFQEFMPPEDKEKFKEIYEKDNFVKITTTNKDGEEEKEEPHQKNEMIKFFIYGWIKISFFILVSFAAELIRQNLKEKIIKRHRQKLEKERLEIEALKELKREEELNNKIRGD